MFIISEKTIVLWLTVWPLKPGQLSAQYCPQNRWYAVQKAHGILSQGSPVDTVEIRAHKTLRNNIKNFMISLCEFAEK